MQKSLLTVAVVLSLTGCVVGSSGGVSAFYPPTSSQPSSTTNPKPSTPSNPKPSTPVAQPNTPSNPKPSTPTVQPSTPSNPKPSIPVAQPNIPDRPSNDEWNRPNKQFLVTRPSQNIVEMTKQAINETNKLRLEKGLAPLRYDPDLAAYAQVRANEIVNSFNHSRSNGSHFAHEALTGLAGENIAAGQANSNKVVDSWRKSPGHYQNIIKKDFSRIGMGLVYIPNSQYGFYWVQIFGGENATSNYHFSNESSPEVAVPNDHRFFKDDKRWSQDTLVVNGKLVNLLPKEQTSTPFADMQQIEGVNRIIASGNHVQSARYGVVQEQAGEPFKVFIKNSLQGKVEKMPQTGSAVYTGHAVAVDRNNQVKTNLTSQINANFGDKTLTGAIKEGNRNLVNIDAKINGNGFKSNTNAPVSAYGDFYGKNADEVVGSFHKYDDGLYGAFGASKK